MKNLPMKLTTMKELQDSGFGQPGPRHGLQLLHWFANNCIWINDDDDMFLICDPTTGIYGFHLFENRNIGPREKLLPEVGFDYYLVGNLNLPQANMLPKYVKESYTGCPDDSNTDRIIVTVHGNRKFGKIYTTTHNDLKNYDPDATFHISRSLLKIIQSFPEVDDFLSAVENQGPPINCFMMVQITDPAMNRFDEKDATSTGSADIDKPRRNCGCTIL